ncbi:MAG: mannose-6-phosphate isomerase [Lachnospiraceae bacterium]|nr:mannose-6-phosphate isomerase [Lachnospiraceae bacterium]
MYPMKLTPAYKDYLWGGNELSKMYGKESGLSVTAESWELCCHPDGQNKVANGQYKGRMLADVLRENPHYVSSRFHAEDRFPVLIKFIDAAKALSIQVHPSDETALKELGEEGKAEMWYIVKAKPRAFLYYGLNQPVSKEKLREKILDGTVCDVLNKVYVHEGDVFFILPGTIHAIGEGIVIAEIQQNSNSTFRVYDFGRKGPDGKERELHIERAVDVIDYTPIVPSKIEDNNSMILKYGKIQHLFESSYFKVTKITCNEEMPMFAEGDTFHSLLFTKGFGTIECQGKRYQFKGGDSYYIPADIKMYSLKGNFEALLTTV